MIKILLPQQLVANCDMCNLNRWIQSWATLVTAASSYEPVKQRLILDFIDYPDKAGLEWQSQDNGTPGSGTFAAGRQSPNLCSTSLQLGPVRALLKHVERSLFCLTQN